MSTREKHRVWEASYRERNKERINERRRSQYDPEKGREKALKRKLKNPERFAALNKTAFTKYREYNREKICAAARARYALNRDKERLRRQLYKASNSEKLKEINRRNDARPERRASKAARERTEACKATRRAYKVANPRVEYYRAYEITYREKRKQLHAEKQVTDPQYRLRRVLRARLKQAIKKNQKSGSAVKELGCSVIGLKAYLEAQFEPGMSWGNFGLLSKNNDTWQIDHFHPLSKFDLTDTNQLREACHFSNLRPLWALDNRRKANKTIGRKEGDKCLLRPGLE